MEAIAPNAASAGRTAANGSGAIRVSASRGAGEAEDRVSFANAAPPPIATSLCAPTACQRQHRLLLAPQDRIKSGQHVSNMEVPRRTNIGQERPCERRKLVRRR